MTLLLKKFLLIILIMIVFGYIGETYAKPDGNNLIELCQELTQERLSKPKFRNWNVDYNRGTVSGIATVYPLFGEKNNVAECVFNYRGIQLTQITDLKDGEIWDVRMYNNAYEWK